jgi:arsenite oxidase small subunit
MERRTFIQLCAVGGGCMGSAATDTTEAASPPAPPPKKSGATLARKLYAKAKLVDRDGRAIKARTLKRNHNYVFNYPFEGTPCFLLNLGKPPKPLNELLTEKGDAYAWPGGVGPERSIVAYSAICAHKLAYPSPQVSFISFRDKPSGISSTGGVIGCCADKSVYDPNNGARVLSGPAPQPLATIVIEHDPKTDELFAVATIGGEKFDAFFEKYAFKLSLETGGNRAAERVGKTTVLRDLSAHSQQTAQC